MAGHPGSQPGINYVAYRIRIGKLRAIPGRRLNTPDRAYLLQTYTSCPSGNGRAAMRALANVFKIKAREKCNPRHMVDIPRMTFFAQHRYRANGPVVDEHKTAFWLSSCCYECQLEYRPISGAIY